MKKKLNKITKTNKKKIMSLIKKEKKTDEI